MAGLPMECRQHYPQWLLTVSPAKFTYWISNILCNNRKMSLLLHPTLLILEQANSLLEAELPTTSRELAAHEGLFSGRHPCLGPAGLSGTEGTAGAALGTHSGTHNRKHGRGNQYQVDEQSQGSTVLWIGLRRVHDVCMCVTMLLSVGCSTGNGYSLKCCSYFNPSRSFKGLYRTNQYLGNILQLPTTVT